MFSSAFFSISSSYEVYEIEKYQQCTVCGYKLVIDHIENHEYLECSNTYFG